MLEEFWIGVRISIQSARCIFVIDPYDRLRGYYLLLKIHGLDTKKTVLRTDY